MTRRPAVLLLLAVLTTAMAGATGLGSLEPIHRDASILGSAVTERASVTPQGDEATDTTAGPGSPLLAGDAASFAHEDCEEHFGVFLYPLETWEDRLPEGFAAARDDSGTFSIHALLAPSCIASDGARFGELWEVILVEPPEHLALSDGPNALLLGLTTSDATLAATWSAWGYPEVRLGTLTMQSTELPGARSGMVTMTNDAHEVRLHTSVVGEGAPNSGPGRIFIPDGVGGLAAIWDFHVETELDYTEGVSLLEAGEGFVPWPTAVQPGLAWHRVGETITFRLVPVSEP